VIEARDLEPILNPVKCFLIAMFTGKEHVAETEHRTASLSLHALQLAGVDVALVAYSQ